MAETGTGSRSQGGVRTKQGAVDKTENSKYLQLLRLLADILAVPSRTADDKDSKHKARKCLHSPEQTRS
jgi:hypothetical protein